MDYFKSSENFLSNTNLMVPIMKKIAEPLFLNTKINSFSYLKFGEDSSVINLTTDMEWIKYRFNEKIKYQILFQHQLKDITINKPYIYLWPHDSNSKILNSLLHYGIWNGCNIVIISLKYIEVFSFATSVENVNLQNYYINNIDILNGFIIDFREKVLQIINQKHHIITDITFPINEIRENTLKNKLFYFKDINHTKPKKVRLDSDISMTIKELECCYHLMRGASLKEIGLKINLSDRTVETHLNNAKLKSNSINKQELLEHLSNNKWIIDALFNNTK